jgi:hypothetical protein
MVGTAPWKNRQLLFKEDEDKEEEFLFEGC